MKTLIHFDSITFHPYRIELLYDIISHLFQSYLTKYHNKKFENWHEMNHVPENKLTIDDFDSSDTPWKKVGVRSPKFFSFTAMNSFTDLPAAITINFCKSHPSSLYFLYLILPSRQKWK